jgi:hypothetical protein
MKHLILWFGLIAFSFANQYTFLVNQYNKDLELEAKIISTVAQLLIKKKPTIYMPNMSEDEQKAYGAYFKIASSCKQANFVYIKTNNDIESSCSTSKRFFFTNNYRMLLNNKLFNGAFFWSKSRPNIVLVKERLAKKGVVVPKKYEQFVEKFE